MSKNVITGGLYRAKKKSSALTTNPWELTNRTISFLDHKRIEKNDIALLIEHAETDPAATIVLENVGIFVFIFNDKIVWQIMGYENFDKCWELLQ